MRVALTILPYKAHIVDTLHHQWYLHSKICLLDSIPTLVLLVMDFMQSFTYLQVFLILLKFEKIFFFFFFFFLQRGKAVRPEISTNLECLL